MFVVIAGGGAVGKFIAQQLTEGNADVVIAGGQESMTLSPHFAYLRTGMKMGTAMTAMDRLSMKHPRKRSDTCMLIRTKRGLGFRSTTARMSPLLAPEKARI